MPYDNPLNRKIADELRKINQAYINHTLNSYDVAESTVGNADKKLVDSTNIFQKQNELENKEHLEGSGYGARGGFATGTFRDTGFGSVEGAGKYMNNEVEYENNENNMSGGNFFSDFGKGFKKGFTSVLKPASAILGMLPIPQAQIASKALGVASDLAGGKRRKSGVKKEKEMLLTRVMEGGQPSKMHIGELKKGRGRPKKMKGGGGEGLVQAYNMVRGDGTTGNGKPKSRIVGGHKLTPVANMHSSSMAGQGKKTGCGRISRAEIVKKIMKDRGVSMIEASSIVKKEGLYKK